MKLFLVDAEKRRDACERDGWSMGMAAKQIEGWGEKPPKRNSEPDPLSSFFSYIASLLHNINVLSQRINEKQRWKPNANDKRKDKSRCAQRRAVGKRMSLGADDDVFGTINRKLKQGNANDIMPSSKIDMLAHLV